jgi:hypothetical protein
MRTPHRSLMTLTLAAGLAVAGAALHAWSSSAQNTHQQQHVQPADPQAHIDRVVEHLSLTDAQREALADPLARLRDTLDEVHRLHEAIAAELTAEQKAALADAIHNGMAGHMGTGHPRPAHHGGGGER